MKKTKLLTSVAALALVLGLGACNASDCEEVTGDDSVCPTCPTCDEDDGNDETETCNHIYGDWEITDESHSRTCLICGESTGLIEHNIPELYTVAPDDERYCVKACADCGYELARSVHQVDENGKCARCATEGLNIEGFTYTLNGDEVSYSVTKYDMTLSARDVYVPTAYKGEDDEVALPVTGVGTATASGSSGSVFSGSASVGNALRFVGLPDTINDIHPYSFYQIYSLKSIEIPEGVTKIGDRAFYNDYSLETFIMSDTITEFGTYVFENCYALKNVRFSQNLETIGQECFYKCAFDTLLLPASLKSIGNSGFGYSYSLVEVYYGGTPESWNEITIGSSNGFLTAATRYYYDEDGSLAAAETGDNLYWHYDEAGEIAIW